MAKIDPIYCLLSVHSMGSSLEGSEEVPQKKCRKCNCSTPPRRQFTKIRIELDYWTNINFFRAGGAYIVTENLRTSMIRKDIKGVKFKKSKVSKSAMFSFDLELAEKKIPNLYLMMILNDRVNCNSIVFDVASTCNACGLKIVTETKNANKILLRGIKLEPDLTELEVHKDSWDGSDIFYCELHSEPVMTKKMFQLLESFDRDNVKVAPARWV